MEQVFGYSAYSKSGERVEGTLEAASHSEALAALRQKGLVPVSVSNQQSGVEQPWWSRQISFSSSVVPLRDVARLCDTLAALTKAGFSMVDAVKTATELVKLRVAKDALRVFEDSLRAGQSQRKASEVLRGVFPAEFVDLIALGDTSNTMDTVLASGARLFRKRAEMREKVSGALVYPLILIAAALLVFLVLILFLAPNLKPIFAAANAEPGGILRALFWMNGLFVQHWVLLLAALPLVVGLSVFALTTRAVRRILTDLLERLPGISSVLRSGHLANATRSTALLMESGMPVHAALRAVGKTAQGGLGTLFEQAAAEAERGGDVAPVFERPAVPSAFQQFIAAAELSNQWAPVLTSAADLFEAEAARGQERLTELLTPALTILIGAFIGVMMLSIVGAILDVNELSFT